MDCDAPEGNRAPDVSDVRRGPDRDGAERREAVPLLLRPVEVVTLRADDPAAIAPPTDDELIAAWDGGKAGKLFADSVPKRFRALMERSLFESQFGMVDKLHDAFERGTVAALDTEERRLAALRRGKGRQS